VKYNFTYPKDKLLDLAKAVKVVVDDKSSHPDWSDREDSRAELKFDLIVLLAEYGYPQIEHDGVYKEIIEQAENFKNMHK
jgi:type I restriction enzyme R subunit